MGAKAVDDGTAATMANTVYKMESIAAIVLWSKWNAFFVGMQWMACDVWARSYL